MKRYEATQKILQEAREALIGYAMSHKDASGKPYLPCPDKTTASGIAPNLPNDGIEDRAMQPGCPCDTPEGNFPWATLGVGNADAWGNRLRYRVDTSAIPTPTTDSQSSIAANRRLQSRFVMQSGMPAGQQPSVGRLSSRAVVLSLRTEWLGRDQ